MERGYIHRVMVRRGSSEAARSAAIRIEHHLGVETFSKHEEGWGWTIDFVAPRGVDLSFLEPDILPPGKGTTT